MTGRRNVSGDWTQIMVEFGQRIRRIRQCRGMTQEDLARASGVSRNQIQNVEAARGSVREVDGKPVAGSSNPTMDTIWAIARALDVEVAYLVAREAGPEGADG